MDIAPALFLDARKMDAFQLKAALREVRELRSAIIEKQRLRGFSGRARALGGALALVAGWGLSAPTAELSESVAFGGWGAVFAGAWLLNYGAVAFWHLRRGADTGARPLRPHLETLPAWIVAGIITLALWRRGDSQILYGMWMLLFGLMQTTHRNMLPREIAWVGLYYIVAGAACVFAPLGFVEMAPVMGTVFFLGEFLGGLIFHADGDWHRIASFLGLGSQRRSDRDE